MSQLMDTGVMQLANLEIKNPTPNRAHTPVQVMQHTLHDCM